MPLHNRLDDTVRDRASVAGALQGANLPECCCNSPEPYGRWYVAVTEFRQESMARDAIQAKLGLSAFLPQRLEGLGRNRFWRPFFPGYLFVLFDIQRDCWRDLYRTQGVRRLLGSDPWTPKPVPGRSIAVLLRAADKHQSLAEPARAFLEAGIRVRVMDGLLEGAEGVVRRGGSRRVLVELDGIAFPTTMAVDVLREVVTA